jgi:hypothetical protein
MRNIVALALAVVLLVAAPAAAEASASAGPSATFAFAKESISSNDIPRLTYQTRNLPSGSRLSLQFLKFGASQSWTLAEILPGPGGTTTAPALPGGLYRFRIRVLEGQAAVAVSAWRYLNVTPVTSHASCGVCTVLGPVAGALFGWLLDLL